jgi:hypothetical protein
MMKKLMHILFVGAGLTLISCEKEALELDPAASASMAYIHAAPGAPTVDVVVDGIVANGARRLTYGTVSSSGGAGNGAAYMPLQEGTRNIKISTDSGRTNVVNADLTFDRNKYYTMVVYDTLAATGTPSLRSVRFEDNLAVPATGTTAVRFFHLAPLAPAVDVTLLRTSATPNDSVTITNRSYFGTSPNASVAAFTAVPGGTYTVRVKAAGTQTVVFSAALGANLSAGRIVTLAAIGTARGAALNAMVLRHF